MNSKRPIIVAFDEFQDILGLAESDAALAVMRTKIQSLGTIPFCFAGSVRNDMWQIFSSSDSPFYKSAVSLEVGPTDFTGWTDFLASRFKSGKRKITPEVLERLVGNCRRKPGRRPATLRRRLGQHVHGLEIDDRALAHALQYIYRNEHKGYEQVIAASSAQQVAVLRTLASLGGESIQSKPFLQEAGITHASSVKAAMTRLVSRRIVFHDGNAYRFSNPFLRHWLIDSQI